MNPQRWRQAKHIFCSVLEHAPVKRAEFLAETCAQDDELRREVEALLAAHEAAEQEHFIEAPVCDITPTGFELRPPAHELSTGRRFGPYEILKEIARGGMGRVHLAARADDAYQKQVAVKLVDREHDGAELRRRLVHEREILAGLDHPHIARLVDGGTTADGLPYLVMEYVEGDPITEYCERHKLSINDRLKLFCAVCAAVQYAHQRLVIHRDLKPANILVTADGTPKLLDFGIAKLLDQTPANAAQTVTQLRVMTPAYASPEQIRGEQITTASDIYSLGVLLYELLTGRRPYQVKGHRPDELARIICEEMPARPSQAATRGADFCLRRSVGFSLRQAEDDARAQAEAYATSARRLKGDLDNIILMAMRKEPQRRYASAEQFAADIRRHLEGRPVLARTDSFGYRAGKFIRRNRLSVAAAALTLLALVGGLVMTLWQARVARAERDRARAEAAKAARVNEFLQGIFKEADPRVKGGDAKVVEVLNDAGGRIDTELAGQPELLAAAHQTIGETYVNLGLLDTAETHLRAALEANQRIFGPEHPATAKNIAWLGWLLYGKGNYADAETLLRRALALQRKPGVEREHDLADTLGALGDLLRYKGNLKEAEPLLEEALADYQRVLGGDNEYVATVLNSLALVREAAGDHDGAETLYRQSVAVFRRLPYRQRIRLPLTLMNLSANLMLKGQYAEAESLLLEALDYNRSVVGDANLIQARPLTALGELYLQRGDYQKAEEMTMRALEIQRRLFAEDNPELARALALLGLILTRAGQPARGEPLLRRALELRRQALGAEHLSTRANESALGECLTAQKRYAEAESLLTQSCEALRAGLGAQHPMTVEALRRVIRLYEAWQKPEQVARYQTLLPRG